VAASCVVKLTTPPGHFPRSRYSYISLPIADMECINSRPASAWEVRPGTHMSTGNRPQCRGTLLHNPLQRQLLHQKQLGLGPPRRLAYLLPIDLQHCGRLGKFALRHAAAPALEECSSNRHRQRQGVSTLPPPSAQSACAPSSSTRTLTPAHFGKVTRRDVVDNIPLASLLKNEAWVDIMVQCCSY
jgi:hypothetical protein